MPATLIFYEAPTRLARTLHAMIEIFAGREIAVARELTKRFEEIRRGSAADLADWAANTEVRGEIVLVVSPPEAKPEVRDEDILQALRAALVDQRLKDAARLVADRLGVSRTRVYDLGLHLKSQAPE